MTGESENIPRQESERVPGRLRYLGALAVLCAAWVVTSSEPRVGSGLVWLVAIGWSLYLMREVGMVLLWLLVMGLLIWLLIMGLGALSALPVGGTILIGAWMISRAISNTSRR